MSDSDTGIVAQHSDFIVFLEEHLGDLFIVHINQPVIILVVIIETGDFLLLGSKHQIVIMRVKASSGGFVPEFEHGVHVQCVLWIGEFNDPVIIFISLAVLTKTTHLLLVCDRRTNLVGVEIFLSDIM